jgi:hypothetical protein
MKIAVCGSFAFASKMLSVSKELTNMGHEVILPLDIMTAIKDPTISSNINWCIENDVIRDPLEKIISCDAILVLNYQKGNIAGYVGGNTLIELGFAYFYRKKIYLLYPIPKELSYSAEIEIMQPKILDGDFSRI